MRRRKALQQFGLLATAASTGGCAAILGGGNQTNDDGDRKRSGSLESKDISFEKGDNNNLVVIVSVKNNGDSKSSATLKVSVVIDDATHELKPKVTVPGGKTKDVRVPFEVAYSKYTDGSQTSIDINLL